ncbi:MAG TPA: GNAT family N-acetyltransferase [Candidatus Paceibacterota bacterium]|nr:GNAT family N-acetyltransferase [Candidatus Paceibacterota bacterium]
MDLTIKRTHRISALAQLEKKIFPAADCLVYPEDWEGDEAFWILADGKIVGMMTFYFDWSAWRTKSPRCLYIESTGVLPEFRRKGIGSFAKEWQIQYARSNGFTRIETSCRESNAAIVALNRKFGFLVLGRIPHFYVAPDESGIIFGREL